VEAEELAAEYEASGLRREEFCRQKGVALHTLARYVARRRRERAVTAPAQRWVGVEVAEAEARDVELTIRLDGGRRIEVRAGFDAETLRRVVGVLESV